MTDKNLEEVVNGIHNYLENAIVVLPKKIEKIREGEELDSVADLIESLNIIFTTCKTLEIDCDFIYDGFLIEKTNEILEAFENEDFSLISDILEYEFLEKLEEINKKCINL